MGFIQLQPTQLRAQRISLWTPGTQAWPAASSISTTQELLRNAKSQTSPPTYWVIICVFTEPCRCFCPWLGSIALACTLLPVSAWLPPNPADPTWNITSLPPQPFTIPPSSIIPRPKFHGLNHLPALPFSSALTPCTSPSRFLPSGLLSLSLHLRVSTWVRTWSCLGPCFMTFQNTAWV